MTPFTEIYDLFLSKVTDDMYMELTKGETEAMLTDLLMSSMHFFEFPRQDIYNYDLSLNQFNVELTTEEKNILATYMIVAWLDQQLATIELVRMKYSSSDYSFTSQANHLNKVMQLKKEYERVGFHLQRLYKRRIQDDGGVMRSTFDTIMETPPYWKKNI